MSLYLNDTFYLENIVEAKTFLQRLRGYMFYKSPQCDVLMITPCNSIHTFFMYFNIDVLFLDEEMIVIKKELNLGKRKVLTPVKNAIFVLEAKAGMFTDVSIGDGFTIC